MHVNQFFFKRLKTIGLFHSDLTNLLEKFIEFFNVPYLLLFTAISIQIIIDAHMLLYFLIMLGDYSQKEDIYAFTLSLNTFSSRIFSMYFICHVPDATCDEVIFCINNKN